MNKNKLYNVFFPIWFFFVYPTVAWLIILPFNFIFDSLVIFFTNKSVWKHSIFKVWILGFLSDFIGGALTFGLYALLSYNFPGLGGELVFWPGATLLAIPGVLVAGILIYILNLKLSFNKADIDSIQKRKLALRLALITAPFLMLIPIYG